MIEMEMLWWIFLYTLKEMEGVLGRWGIVEQGGRERNFKQARPREVNAKDDMKLNPKQDGWKWNLKQTGLAKDGAKDVILFSLQSEKVEILTAPKSTIHSLNNNWIP